VSVGEHTVQTGASVGIAIYPHNGTEPEALLKSADLAMYQVKESGRGGYRFYADPMLRQSREKMQLRQLLNQALAREELVLHYQPLVDVTTGRVQAMEALLRWQNPELGLVPPGVFIPAAEQMGCIVAIGEWVLRAACRQLAEWRASDPSLSVGVNVSARQLSTPGFVETVLSALEESRVEPAALEIELTESAALAADSATVLARLARAGVRIAIDDFGSGYSSFQRIKDLPIHTLKVDRSLVQNVASDPRDGTIFSTIVGMAHALGIGVVAEGVETEAQLRALQTLKWHGEVQPVCDRAQGFLFSRPLPVEQATALLPLSRHVKTQVA
jgi:EAL domain-containing protein (putative c-di-GMP-specific phosphodiesterase class I)